jgi:hypothetical protein
LLAIIGSDGKKYWHIKAGNYEKEEYVRILDHLFKRIGEKSDRKLMILN